MTDDPSLESLLGRIRTVLERCEHAPPPEPPAIEEDIVRRCGDAEDLVARFTSAATAAGAVVTTATNEMLIESLAGTLTGCGARHVVLGIADDALLQSATAAVNAAEASVIDWRPQPGLEAHYVADAGITDVAGAVAETGSVIVGGAAARSRGTWLVPPVHIAVVPASLIVADLLDVESLAAPAGGPAYRVLVTGPSKTADIEGELVTGLHVPGAVHVLIVADG
jgi:L-lactate dehydrogenase complex protein LldG